MNKKRIIDALLIVALASQGRLVLASDSKLESAHKLEMQITQDAVSSQNKINASSEAAMQLAVEIEQLQAELKELEVYRDHLQSMVKSQKQELASFDVQLGEIEQTRESIVPLMYNMLDGLAEHISQDRPIREKARRERLSKLKHMMVQADISDAEKYRRILEAFQIELDYGTKLGSYSGTIEVDGHNLLAEQLYLGRISLVARSADRQNYWAWHAEKEKWQPMSASAGRDADKAFNIANQLAAPALLNLPISVKTAADRGVN